MTKGRINYWTAEANRGHNWTFTAYWVRDSYLIRCYDQNGTRIPGMFTLVNDEAMDYPPDNERLMNLVLARDEAEDMEVYNRIEGKTTSEMIKQYSGRDFAYYEIYKNAKQGFFPTQATPDQADDQGDEPI